MFSPLPSPSSNQTIEDDAWVPIHDTSLYNVILWTPFIAIPTCIIFFRIIKYLWRIYKAKRAGYGEDFINDPLTELGLNLNRSYDDLTEIRKIRKERARLMKWEAKQAKLREKQKQLESEIVGSDGVKQKEPETKLWMQNLAENYIVELRKKTQDTWSERLSPVALRHWMNTSRWGRIWMIFQVLCTIAAIINYVLLTYSIQRTDRKLIKIVDIVLATFFLMDYSLSFYVADDRLRFYFNPASLIDLMSVIPPFVYVFVSDTSKYVWFLGLLRIFRASRILRTYRLLSFSESEEKREMTILGLWFLNFVFLSASIINALETLEIDLNQPASLTYWHDSLYYIMVTFSTIGFGDLTPSSIPSRIVVMSLIVVVIIFVPLQTTRLVEFYNMTSPFQRARYTQKSARHSHVILTGSVSYTALIDFCREYFATDESGHVVILVQEEPSLEIKRMLRHPFYRSKVFFLNGSPLALADLRRANAVCATAIFLLNAETGVSSGTEEEEQLRVTRGADAEILMQSLVAKTNYPDLAVFAQVEEIRSQDLAPHCGISRVLCLDEIKMSLLARNCVVPGVLTLIFNLVHTYKTLDANTLDSKWMREYNQGSINQVYAFKFPSGLIGMRFAEVVNIVYCSFGATIFALVGNHFETNANFISQKSNQDKSHRIRLNPGKDYKIRDTDVALCIVTGGDATILRIVFQFKEKPSAENLPKSALRYKFDLDEIDSSSESYNQSKISLTNPFEKKSEEFLPQTFPPSGVLEEINETISNHIIICGSVTARAVRHFIRSIREGNNIGDASNTPIVCMFEKLPSNILEDGIWKDVLKYERVYMFKGTPLKKTSLVQAGITRVKRIVVFRSESGGSKRAATDFSQTLDDSNSVFIVKMIQEEWPYVPYIVELINGANVKFFANRFAGNSHPTSPTAETPENPHFLDPKNLNTTKILDNYALSINDRLTLYRKIRQDSSEQTSFFRNVYKFTMSAQSPKGHAPSVPQYVMKSYEKHVKSKLTSPIETMSLVDGAASPGKSSRVDKMRSPNIEKDPESARSDERLSTPKKKKKLYEQIDANRFDEYDSSDSEIDESTKGDGGVTGFTNAFLQSLEEEAELNETGLIPFPVHHFDRRFAAGMVTPLGFMHSLLCQAYFRPYIIDVVRALSSNIILTPVHPLLNGKRYVEVIQFMLKKGHVVLGVLRNARKRATGSGLALDGQANLPYVYTNPIGSDIMSTDDDLFVIPPS